MDIVINEMKIILSSTSQIGNDDLDIHVSLICWIPINLSIHSLTHEYQ